MTTGEPWPRARARRLAATLMAVALAVVMVPPSSADEPEATCSPPELGQEWIIWGVVECRDRELHVRHIVVRDSGSLTLENVTLILHPQGQYEGLLTYAQTTVPVGARLVVRDSTMKPAADAGFFPYSDLSGTVLIERTEIASFDGIIISSTQSADLRQNHFVNTSIFDWSKSGNTPGNLVVEDNFFEGPTQDPYTIGTDDSGVFRNNTFVNCGAAILGDTGEPIIEDNTVTGCRVGLSNINWPHDYDPLHNDLFNNWDRTRPWLGVDAAFGGDGPDNYWGCRGPPGGRFGSLFEHGDWFAAPVHPERLPQPVTTVMPSVFEAGAPLQLDGSGSLPSQHFGFPLESYEWRMERSGAPTWLPHEQEERWWRLSDNVTIIEGAEAAHVFDETGSYDVTLTVYDEKGLNHCIVHQVEVVRTPPELTVSLTPEAPFAGDALQAVVSAEDALDGNVDLSYDWKRNGVTQAIDGATVPSHLVDTGDAWSLLVTATGSNGAVSTATADVVVGNHAPTATVSISPGMATTESDLVAHAVGSDEDGHEVTLAYEWFRDGVLASQWSGPGVPASATAKGEAWKVRVTPNDSYDAGAPVESSVTIANSPPIVQSASASPSTVLRGDPVTLALNADDADEEPVTVTWRLPDDSTLEGQSVETSFPEPGTYTVAYEATDSTATATGTVNVAVEDATVEFQDIAFHPDPVSFGQDLVAVVDVDAPDGYTLTYLWARNGVDAGITSNTIPADQLNGMDQWTVTATVSQGGDADTEEASITIPNRAPAATVTLPASAQTSDDVTALVTGSDPDGHAVTYAYAWLRDGILQDHAGAILPASLTSRGESWTVQVTLSDGYDDGMPVEATVVIENTPPEIQGVAVPATVHPGESVMLSVAASDADEDPLAVTWMLPSGTATGANVEATFTEAGTYQVPVTVSDGTSEATTTVELVVSEVPVVIHDVRLPDPVVFDEDLAATVDASGPGGMTVTYAWHRNGALTDVTGPSVPKEDLNGLDAWSLTVTASHEGDVQSVTASVVVPNRAPFIEDLQILPGAAVGGQALSVDVEAVDPDGHEVTFEVQWFRNAVEHLVGDVVPGSDVVKGDQWLAVVTPSDETDMGLPAEAAVTIANAPPIIASAGATPNPVIAGSAVQLAVDASDADGDELSITWMLPGGQALSGASAYAVFGAVGNHLVRYTVSDGEDAVTGSFVVNVEYRVSSGGSGGGSGGGNDVDDSGDAGQGDDEADDGENLDSGALDDVGDGSTVDGDADDDGPAVGGAGQQTGSLDGLEADDEVGGRGLMAHISEVTAEDEADQPGAESAKRDATGIQDNDAGFHSDGSRLEWWMPILAAVVSLLALLVSGLLLAAGLKARRDR